MSIRPQGIEDEPIDLADASNQASGEVVDLSVAQVKVVSGPNPKNPEDGSLNKLVEALEEESQSNSEE